MSKTLVEFMAFPVVHVSFHATQCINISRVVPGSPTVNHMGRKRWPKWERSGRGYNWATLSPGVINTEVWSSRLGVGSEADNLAP
jgi:hypothetical protein